ncbi:hypothetical protein [Undibacterium sp. TS12]|uniref:hypothetical protein n=1 Tax=Undibacterium sp. TS12 TaxID=2908202 RepID=UPI001F4CA23F|nr:hypothetical protein [Undibacterium sp. TS12]MCH8622569.1 hypothetical protein [Undibacterium sp. TS12]
MISLLSPLSSLLCGSAACVLCCHVSLPVCLQQRVLIQRDKKSPAISAALFGRAGWGTAVVLYGACLRFPGLPVANVAGDLLWCRCDELSCKIKIFAIDCKDAVQQQAFMFLLSNLILMRIDLPDVLWAKVCVLWGDG